MKCKDCKYIREIDGNDQKNDMWGCIFGNGFYPMFLDEDCSLKEPFKTQVYNEHTIKD